MFNEEWVFWPTTRTTLSAGTTYIFTSYMSTAFSQPVAGGSQGDSFAGYPGGSGYSALVPTTPGGVVGDIAAWTSWTVHPWDFNFRVQQRNPACP
jgi:hypothetical protein